MREYVRWSFRQFYLLVFWPTQFEREVEDDRGEHGRKLRFRERFRYMLRMLPWMVVFATLSNAIAGLALEGYGLIFRWTTSWVYMVVVMALMVALGSAVAVSLGMVPGVVLSVLVGVLMGLHVPATVSVNHGLIVGSAAFGAAFEETFGVMSIVFGGAVGVAFAVICAVMFTPRDSVRLGIRLGAGGSVGVGVLLGVVMGLWGTIESRNLHEVVYGRMSGLRTGMASALTFPLVFWLVGFRLAIYPIDVALSVIAYAIARRKPSKVLRAWKYCPVTWNEVIWLPLPYVGRLLALLVRQNREEGFRQITFVAAERQLQRRVVLTALAEVAFDDLQGKSISELAGVADKLGWTTDAPAQLPAELSATLPRFDQASQLLGQYLTLQGSYRRSESLDRALAGIDGLQRSLVTSSGYLAPRLLQTANEWRRLIEVEQELLRAQQEQRHIPNPFLFGTAVTERDTSTFSGRRDIVRQVEECLFDTVQAPTLLLHGPRRMGKTSILNQLPRMLGPDFAPAAVDCQNPAVTGSPAALLRYLSRALSQGLQRRRVTVEPLTREQVEREPFDAFDEWLDAAERAMPPSMRALLCLDEYERLQEVVDAGWGTKLLDALRHTLQHRRRVVLMFTGAHTFEEQGPVWTDRFISARRIRVSFLTREEVEPLLTRPIPEFDMTYADGALDALFDFTRGQPFLTQAVAFELVRTLNEGQRKEATPADVETAVARALESGGEYFANVWSDAREDGQAVLLALVRSETPPDHPRARAWLREHDVLNDRGDFAVPMVARWVRERKAGG